MTEPDNLVLEHLRAIRAKLDQLEAKFDAKLGAHDARFEALREQFEGLELKLDGLTHAVIAGFGSLVHELDALKARVSRLDLEPA